MTWLAFYLGLVTGTSLAIFIIGLISIRRRKMKLKDLKICLDCDEVFIEGQQCPICASEQYTFIVLYFSPLTMDTKKKSIEGESYAN